jgi:beta-galactosidase
VTTRTRIADNGAADLSVSVAVNAPDAAVRGKLLSPTGETLREFELPRGAEGRYASVVHVDSPQLWTAETPSLYRLQLTLSANGQPLQTLEERVGLREISIVDGVLKLNGRPIKLRGVDRHDEAPDVGRATRTANWQKDLQLMKQGNINFVRTSHSPPNEGFIAACDEAGIYVLCEVPLAHFQSNLKNDPAYRANVMARVEQTLGRDKNHPSVIAWSIGNENNVQDLLFEAGKHAKEVDPSRPICYPTIGTYFDENAARFPPFVDLYALHYPTNAMLKHWTETLDRPTILTEYSHANGLATDHIQDQWDMMQASPHFGGGAIWHFMDQGLLRTSDKPVDRSKPTSSVWVDATHFYDTHGTNGQDGILYADRTPQTDFWETRKVYAPVQFVETTAAVKPGPQEIALTVENRYDFRSLAGMKLAWTLERNGTTAEKGELALRAPSHDRETLHIPLTIPTDTGADVLALNVRCLDEKGMAINERALRLELPGGPSDSWLTAAPSVAAKVTQRPDDVRVDQGTWVLAVSRTTGAATITDKAGRVLVAGILPHAGRKLTDPERGRVKRLDMWPTSTLDKAEDVQVKVSQGPDGVKLEVSGRYPRPGAPEQSFIGGYVADITTHGAMTIHYSYTPTAAKGSLAEAGLSVVVPRATEFRWIGQGPYCGYPGKDRLNDFGLFHLNRDDLRFQGNRRHTRVALLTTPTGAGVALLAEAADVAVERDGDQTLLSSNAVISGLGEKGRTPETLVDAAKTEKISGAFTLLPLQEAWPETLVRWFGKPAAAAEVYRPFYHSYDQ